MGQLASSITSVDGVPDCVELEEVEEVVLEVFVGELLLR
jgi:hypothetical protein